MQRSAHRKRAVGQKKFAFASLSLALPLHAMNADSHASVHLDEYREP